MYDPDARGVVEDYTDAFLVTFCMIVFMALGIVWAVYGFVAALVLGVAAFRGLAWLDRRRNGLRD